MSKTESRPDAAGELQAARCAFCGKALADRQGVGSGSLEDGLFCNLDCYALAFPMRVAQGQRNAKRRSN